MVSMSEQNLVSIDARYQKLNGVDVGTESSSNRWLATRDYPAGSKKGEDPKLDRTPLDPQVEPRKRTEEKQMYCYLR